MYSITFSDPPYTVAFPSDRARSQYLTDLLRKLRAAGWSVTRLNPHRWQLSRAGSAFTISAN